MSTKNLSQKSVSTGQYTCVSPGAVAVEGEGMPRRNILFKDALSKYPEGVTNLHENLKSGVKISGNLPFLGHRVIVDGNAGPYEWQSYNQVFARVTNLGAYYASLGYDDNTNIGLFSINRPEWVIAEHACFMYSFVTVPLYDTLGPDAIEYIVNQTEMPLIVATSDKAKILLEIKSKLPSLSTIVIMDDLNDDLVKLADETSVKLITITEAESHGEKNPVDAKPMPTDGIATICYTSGTTGLPKGVILTHGNMLADAASGIALMSEGRFYNMDKTDLHISYLPLAHVFERLIQLMVTHVGASIGFYQGDTLKLLDDVAELKPTVFASVPRLFNRIYDKVLSGVKSKGGIAAYLFNTAYAAKKKALSKGTVKHWLWDSLVFGAVRSRLGGNVRCMVTGAAPISAEVIDFLRICFSVEMYEGYGQTETSAALSITDRFDLESGHVGVPLPCLEVKLVDIPHMNYSSKDEPLPRGEICVKGANVFTGYYKLPDKTAEAIDSDGWCHTGDIGLWDEKGRLRIIDRVKNIFKLAQGEYIAPEKIENVYARHELVAQIFVYGDSLQATLVGIVVPDIETLKPWAVKNNLGESTLEEYCRNDAVLEALFKELVVHAKESDLKGFEMLKAIRIHHDLFTAENGLLTPTFKLKRHEAKKMFQNEIDSMYAQINK